MKLLVLDGNSILNRAFYGIKLLTTKNGQYTNAIFGFMNILLKLQESEKPDEIAIAFDLKAPTFRHKMFDGYKAQRKGMPEELAAQLPFLKQLLTDLGYVQVSLEGYEADDILGTLALACAQRNDTCLLATGDRDSLQLVQPGVSVLLTTTKMGRGETTCMDETAILEKYGVTPKQLIETKALMGDASDNIPGVAGVGEKTAFALIQKFGTVENIYNNLDDPSIKPGVRQKLINGRESAELSYQLAVINCHVPIPTNAGTYKKQKGNPVEAAKLFSQLEMSTMLTRFGLDETLQSDPKAEDETPLPIATLQTLSAPLIGKLYLTSCENGWLILPQNSNSVYFSTSDNPSFLSTLTNPNAEKFTFDSKELHKLCFQHCNSAANNIVFDAKLAAYLINPSGGNYQPKHIAPEYGIQPTFICEEYPEASILQSLFETLHKTCEENGMLKLLNEIELPLAEVLASMEEIGVAVDEEGIRTFGLQLQKELDKQLAEVYNAAGYEFNLNSPKQLSEALFEKMGLPHGKKTKSGWSTDAETLEGLREYSPIIDTILLYRTYQKLNSTYVEGLLKVIGEDGRIHSTFNQTEARTGRLSSNEPNMQNIPVRTELGSQMRKFFVASTGKTFADADYSQIELRILADISNDKAMQNAFLEGHDIHQATAAKVNGLPIEMVTPQLRSAAKAVNFGIVYGIGAFSLSKDIGVSVKEANTFIENYLNNFPGVRTYMDTIVEFGKEHGYVETLFGRRRPLPELASSNHNIQALGRRIAMNTPIQGTAADIIKIAMVNVYKRLQKENLAAKLVLQVHDELIVEAPENEIDIVAKLLKEEMENAVHLSIPMQTDVHIGKNWLQAKG